MTENKRFVNKGKDIFQYGEWWCSANGEHCADVIATALNELINENEQLKSENSKIKSLLFQKIKELNDDYKKGAKAGMPTGGIIGELDSFEEICEEMGWKND